MRAPPIRITEDGPQYAERLRREYIPQLNALDAPFRSQPHTGGFRERFGMETVDGVEVGGFALSGVLRQDRLREQPIVPSSNRGLNSLSPPPAFASNEAALAIVDYLTFTAPVSVLMDGEFGARVRAAAVKGCESSIELLARHALHAVQAPGLTLDAQVKGFLSFYDHHMVIRNPGGKVAGIFKIGGDNQKGTFCLELTGEGCAHVVAWAHTRSVLEGWGARMTRVDCAHDDREGRYTLDDVKRWHDEGGFTVRRTPAIGFQGYSDGSGQTIYIGKNKGNQQLCVYEKGKQLGDPTSPWVRFEARFGAKYRDIPYDILERPWEYITGHYPPLSWISQVTTRMETAVAKAAAGMAASIRHAKRQCGSVVNVIAEAIPDPKDFGAAVLSLLKGTKFPAWVEACGLGPSVIVPVVRLPEFRPLLA
jgi:DNA relaxase NicK